MHRRNFIGNLTSGYLGATAAAGGWIAAGSITNRTASADGVAQTTAADTYFLSLTQGLLADWCDGMIANQIIAPENPGLHGALGCPSCSHIHGRCSDAVYPFLRMARTTGDQKYIDAAIAVYDWAENNVSQPDGSWTNDINPKSWRGTSIFGAIGLAEALHYHGDLIDDARRDAWTARLGVVADRYLYRDFKVIDFTNLNYGMTAVYGFHLLGEILGDDRYIQRSKKFAGRVKEFFTDPNTLLWGEGKPNDNLSGRGLLPVDLGYNVEESLNGVVLYALEVEDAELIDLMVKSLEGHLEFMLPDGAWDNSWGTRSQKWSYWGSRTSDGCQPAFGLMAKYNPAFGTAAIKNAELLKRCTADGLLHGGPHYVSHGVKPCMHHTFAHAKVMALVQDRASELTEVDAEAPLPRQIASGVKHFPEIDVWLAAQGPWRATVSAYDSIYKTKSANYLQQPTGGAVSVLYHEKVGTVLAGSMARYIMVEPLNMQPNPGEEFALTPRVETRIGDAWYTNLYDLKAEVNSDQSADKIVFDVNTTIQDEDRGVISNAVADYQLNYKITDDAVSMSVSTQSDISQSSSSTFIVPIISPSGEAVDQVSPTRIEITKPDGTLVIQSSHAMTIKPTPSGRVFNMVPGAEAVPIMIQFDPKPGIEVRCEISVV